MSALLQRSLHAQHTRQQTTVPWPMRSRPWRTLTLARQGRAALWLLQRVLLCTRHAHVSLSGPWHAQAEGLAHPLHLRSYRHRALLHSTVRSQMARLLKRMRPNAVQQAAHDQADLRQNREAQVSLQHAAPYDLVGEWMTNWHLRSIQMHTAGETTTMCLIAGRPRIDAIKDQVRSRAARVYHACARFCAELSSGEVLALSHEGRPFVLRQSPPAQGSLFVLEVGHAGEEAAEIELVKDSAGNWVGFRASEAEGRFLQASRRRVRRLLFFNHNFGTNEQWALVQQPQAPWTHARLQFRHRRFTVRSCRVSSGNELCDANACPVHDTGMQLVQSCAETMSPPSKVIASRKSAGAHTHSGRGAAWLL